ncbi:TonB-dependent receptor [Flavitalea flava]
MRIHTNRRCPVFLHLKLLLLIAAWITAPPGPLMANNPGKVFPASLQPNTISISCREQPLKWIIRQIEKQSGLSFIYSNDDLDINKKYSVAVKKRTLNEALQAIFSPLKLEFEIRGDKVLLHTAPPVQSSRDVPAGNLPVKSVIVKGKVVDEKGNPLAGVTVELKEPSLRSVTDSEGNFQLQIPVLAGVLTFSYVGYEKREVSLTSSYIAVELFPLDKNLNEVVVVGYGVQKKVSVTGAVDVIRSTSIQGRATPNLTQALQGASPSLTIQQTSFEPGQPININIRGIGTLGDNSPLVVIDGLVGGDLNLLNPNDIDNISILKDAGSAAIYGSRSANGVILITTKKGKKGAGTLSYNGIFSRVKPHVWMKPVKGFENMILKDEAIINSGSGQTPSYSPLDIEQRKELGDEEWFLSSIFQDASQQNHSLSLGGGRDKSTYMVSLGYMDQQSNFVGPAKGLKRYNFRINLSNEVGRLKLSTILAYSRTQIKDHSFTTGTLVVDAERTPPYYKLKDTSGRYLINDVLAQFNPLGILDKGGFRDYDNDNIFGSLNAELKIVRGLTLKGVFGGALDANHQYYETNYVPFYREGQAAGTAPAGVYGSDKGSVTGDENAKNLFLNSQLLLEYAGEFGKHHIQLLGGFTNESYTGKSNKVALNYTSPDLNLPQTSTVVNIGDLRITPQGTTQNSLYSAIGRASYSYNDKYFAEVSFRADGSSKFAKQNRWGYFPSLSLGWRISEEAFFQKSRIAGYFNELKIRGSYGLLGNQNVNNYQYQTTYVVYPNTYGFNGNTAVSGTGFNIANPDLKWEVANTFNIGFDAGLFNRRLNIGFDYFNKLTKDILLHPNLPGTFGGGQVDYNIASVRDRGWEANIAYTIPGRILHQSISLNIGNTNNEIVQMANGQDQLQSLEELQVLYGKGIPIASYVGYKRDGYFRNLKDVENKPRFTGLAVAPGDISYKDKNGDGLIDDNDRYVLGNPFPHYIFGLNYTVSWKNLDLGLLIQGVGQRDMALRGELIEPFHANYSFTMYTHQLDYWRPDNPNAQYPRLALNGSASNTNNFRKGSDLYILNGAYARLKNIQIGYTLSQTISQRLGIQKLRAYLTGQNLLTLTKNRFIDPESSEFHNGANNQNNNLNATNGANSGRSYPTLIYYGFGLEVIF